MLTESGGTSLWFGVRCVFGNDSTQVVGQRLYEERITIWTAADFAAAIERAEAEAAEYAEAVGLEYLGLAQSYEMVDPPTDGAEIFSLMRLSSLPTKPYLDHFFDNGDERQQNWVDPKL